MRLLTLFAVCLLVAGCKGDGGSNAGIVPTDPLNPAPECKGIFSEWTSTTTTEYYDLRGMSLDAIYTGSYIGFNNRTCGPGDVKVALAEPNSIAFQDGFSGYIDYDFGYDEAQDCITASAGTDGGQPIVDRIRARWRIDCDVLTFCQKNFDGTYTCREFN